MLIPHLTFCREITCEKLGITSGQRSTVLEYLQKMAYASSNEQYSRLFEEFKLSVPKAVLDYFNDSWHCIKDEWTLKLKGCCGSFLNSTNNRLESINAKLKQAISRNSSLEEFVDEFFVKLTSLRTERDITKLS
jgi:zinc finger SWIM domain-containing protein 3